MKAKAALLAGAFLASLLLTASAFADEATPVSEAIWVDDVIYGTVITDTSFNLPPAGTTDVIYSFMFSGLAGQRSIADSAPGDRDYNGGRWEVKLAVFTEEGLAVHDTDEDGIADFELTSDAELLAHANLGHIELVGTSIYFECPLLPNN